MQHTDILALFKRAGLKFNQLTYNDEYVDFTVYTDLGRYRWGFNLKYQEAEDQSVGFMPSHRTPHASHFFRDLEELADHLGQLIAY